MKYVALVLIRGAPGTMPLQLDLCGHKSIASALAVMKRITKQHLSEEAVESVLVCAETDLDKFLALFREPVLDN